MFSLCIALIPGGKPAVALGLESEASSSDENTRERVEKTKLNGQAARGCGEPYGRSQSGLLTDHDPKSRRIKKGLEIARAGFGSSGVGSGGFQLTTKRFRSAYIYPTRPDFTTEGFARLVDACDDKGSTYSESFSGSSPKN